MAKGVRRGSPLDKVAQVVVKPGAKTFPGTECDDFPNGIPLPDGIRVRTGRGVEMRFVLSGERISETVRGRPTVAFVLEVARKRERVESLIGLNKLDEAEYALEFPESKRLAALSEEPATAVTVWKLLEDWFEANTHGWSANTAKDYRRAIRNQLIPMKVDDLGISDDEYVRPGRDYKPLEEWSLPRHLGGPSKPVDPLDWKIFGNLPAERVDDVLYERIRTMWQKDGAGTKRINNLTPLLRMAFERALTMKLIAHNPFAHIKPLRKTVKTAAKEETAEAVDWLNAPLPTAGQDGAGLESFFAAEGKPDPFTMAEMQSLLSHLDAAMANQVTFDFWSGLRTGETIALRTNDLDLENNRLLVRRSVSRGILGPTKTKRERWVLLLPPAQAAIEAQIERFGAPGGWVFPNPFTLDRWANDSKITKRWDRAMAAAGVRYRRPYQTRHTYASMMLSSGEHTMHVAEQMGHADWSMLLKVYARWMPAAAENPAGAMVAKSQSKNWSKLAELLAERANVVADESAHEWDSDGTESENELETA